MPRGFDAGRGERSIFLNCPFDEAYRPVFEFLVFTAFECGYVPRCALEIDNAVQVRPDKIIGLIRACPLGVHDISRTELDAVSGLPRFDIPFELGLFVGAVRSGGPRQKRKSCLILDRERDRFQAFLSDIAGQDIAAPNDDPGQAVAALRAWLQTLPRNDVLPGWRDGVPRHYLS